MAETTPAIRQCIEHCLLCYSTCLGMAMRHCLDRGSEHAEPAHLRLMFACAGLCRNCAHVMLFDTRDHNQSCAMCAEVCEDCARDCERIGGMDGCVAACRTCAESCREVAADTQRRGFGAGSWGFTAA